MKIETPDKAIVQEYRTIEARLRERLRKGQWSAGMKLPGRTKLAREFGVAHGTIERAIAPLISEGLLITSDRSGTRVAGHNSQSESPTTLAIRNESVPVGSPSSTPKNLGTLGIVAEVYPDPEDVTDFGDYWTGEIVPTLEKAFQKEGGETIFYNRKARPELVSDFTAVASLLDSGVDALAIVLPSASPVAIAEAVAATRSAGFPLIFISDQRIKGVYPHVFYDQKTNGYQAAQHLLRCGYMRLVFLFPFREEWVTKRIEGVVQALEDAGLTADALTVYVDERPLFVMEGPDVAIAMATPLLRAGNLDGRGVICGNDCVAVGVMDAAIETGRMAGRDFGLVGFDDAPEAHTRGLTTVRPPFAAMAELSARLIARALQGEEMPMQTRMRPYLIPRASTFSPPVGHL